MKKRNPIAVFFLSFVTLGFYAWFWSVRTKTEMNSLGAHIPTAWLWLIPIIGPIWWWWKWSEGVEQVTGNKLSAVLAFILLWILGVIGMAIVQDSFNNHVGAAVPAGDAPTGDTPADTPASPVDGDKPAEVPAATPAPEAAATPAPAPAPAAPTDAPAADAKPEEKK